MAADPRIGPTLTEPELEAALRQGIALFDAGEHWHAHEAWESAWHRAPAAERDFFRGLIHAAAALVHHKKGNAYGFARQCARMERCLASFGPLHRGVDLEKLKEDMAGLPAPGSPARHPVLSRPIRSS